MKLKVKCLKCKETFPVEQAMGGKEINCPYCNQRLLIPKVNSEKQGIGNNKEQKISLKVRCLKCKNTFYVNQTMGGKKTNCPHCNQKLLIPKQTTGKRASKNKPLPIIIFIIIVLLIIIGITTSNTNSIISNSTNSNQNSSSIESESNISISAEEQKQIIEIANTYLIIILKYTDTFLCNAYMKPNKNNITGFMPIDKNNVRSSIFEFINKKYNNYTYQTRVEMLSSFEETYYEQLDSFQSRWEILKSEYGSNLILDRKAIKNYDRVVIEVLNGNKRIELAKLATDENISAILAGLHKHPVIELIKYKNEWIPFFPHAW